jgi:Protein of unknown function (DUF2752)
LGEYFTRDFQIALRIVWLILAGVSGLIVFSPLLFPSSVFLNLFPVCSAKLAGGSCILCGMTTAFVSIGNGDLATATQANRGAITVYVALGMNFLAAVAYTIMRVIRHANP